MKILKKIGSILLIAAVGGIFGYFLGGTIANNGEFTTFTIFELFISLILSFILQIVLHEGGHALFGSLTGYKLISFRIFSWMWVWQEDGKITFQRFKVPGTLGQCLMKPPTYQAEKYPFRLYLLGGVLGNLVTSLIVFLLFSQTIFASVFALVGVFFALTNSIPSGFNDGNTLLLASRSQDNQFLLYLQLQVNYLSNKGLTYNEMPVELFRELSVTKRTYMNDYQSMLKIGLLMETRQQAVLGEELENLWSEKESLILPYQIEIKKELLFYLALFQPEDARIKEIWQDKTIQAHLKQPMMGNQRIIAAYHFGQKDFSTALAALDKAQEFAKNAPTLGEQRMENLMADWLREKIDVSQHEASFA